MVNGGGICLMHMRDQSRVLGIGLYCSPLTALRQDLSLKQKPAVSSSLAGRWALRVCSSLPTIVWITYALWFCVMDSKVSWISSTQEF